MKPECQETLRRAYLFLDEELLTGPQRFEIQIHLEECRPCYERYGLERAVARLVARLRGGEPCPDALRCRIEDLLRG